MASRTSIRIVALGLIAVAAGVGGYWFSRPEPTPPIVGVVRTTEVRVSPEVVRAFEAGADGLELIAVGGPKPADGVGVLAEASWPERD